mmetsp:Transcript_44336/g.87545  ORF Transcript_44336/g.87545 Transcript_44336/m.87545 type:complete len:230 (+) Transcript_44336:1308-1997(+)
MAVGRNKEAAIVDDLRPREQRRILPAHVGVTNRLTEKVATQNRPVFDSVGRQVLKVVPQLGPESWLEDDGESKPSRVAVAGGFHEGHGGVVSRVRLQLLPHSPEIRPPCSVEGGEPIQLYCRHRTLYFEGSQVETQVDEQKTRVKPRVLCLHVLSVRQVPRPPMSAQAAEEIVVVQRLATNHTALAARDVVTEEKRKRAEIPKGAQKPLPPPILQIVERAQRLARVLKN